MAQFFRGGFSSIPPVTRNLMIINALIWLVEVISPQFGLNGIIRHLGLHYVSATYFNPAQILTYMFVHDQGTFFHVFFNMLTLYFFGPALENVWSSKRFFIYYMICGIGAGIVQEVVWALQWNGMMDNYINWFAHANGLTLTDATNEVHSLIAAGKPEMMAQIASMRNSMVTVGASGAIFGVLLGFAFVFPNVPLYLFFIPVPIKAKYMVAGYAVLEFFFGVTGSMISVAHFAHLGGLLFGLIVVLYWKKKGTLYGRRF